jgi:hypothetical protein
MLLGGGSGIKTIQFLNLKEDKGAILKGVTVDLKMRFWWFWSFFAGLALEQGFGYCLVLLCRLVE